MVSHTLSVLLLFILPCILQSAPISDNLDVPSIENIQNSPSTEFRPKLMNLSLPTSDYGPPIYIERSGEDAVRIMCFSTLCFLVIVAMLLFAAIVLGTLYKRLRGRNEGVVNIHISSSDGLHPAEYSFIISSHSSNHHVEITQHLHNQVDKTTKTFC